MLDAAAEGSTVTTLAAGHMQLATLQSATVQALANAACGQNAGRTSEVDKLFPLSVESGLRSTGRAFLKCWLRVQEVSAAAARHMVEWITSQLPSVVQPAH